MGLLKFYCFRKTTALKMKYVLTMTVYLRFKVYETFIFSENISILRKAKDIQFINSFFNKFLNNSFILFQNGNDKLNMQ